MLLRSSPIRRQASRYTNVERLHCVLKREGKGQTSPESEILRSRLLVPDPACLRYSKLSGP